MSTRRTARWSSTRSTTPSTASAPRRSERLVVARSLALLALPAAAAEPEPGVVLTFEGAGGAHDLRVSRLLALRVLAGERPTPFLAPGPFRATFEGFLELEERDRFTFSAALTGALELEI